MQEVHGVVKEILGSLTLRRGVRPRYESVRLLRVY